MIFLAVFSLILTFIFSFLIVHLVKLARIGLRSMKPPEEEKEEKKDEPQQKKNQVQPVYYIVEKKKKRKVQNEYSQPRKINFQDDLSDDKN